MTIAINKSAAAYKPNPAVLPQQQTAQLQATSIKTEQKPLGTGPEVALNLSGEGKQLAKNLPTIPDAAALKTANAEKIKTKPDPGAGASYGQAVGAAATRTTAVKSQLEALQNKQSTPVKASDESNQKGNTVV